MSQPRVVRFLIWFFVTACVLSLSGRLWNKALNVSEGAVGFGGLKEKSQTQAQAHYMMGLFYENQNKFDEAITEYKQTLALEKDIPAPRVRIAANLIRKNDFPGALIELQEAKKLDPENIETGLLLTLLYTIQNSSDKAVQEYEDVLKKASSADPKNVDILKTLAGLYYQQKKFPEAGNLYKLVLDIDKNDYESVFLLGALLEESGKRDEAVEKFKEVLKLKPDYANALNSLGYLYAEDGRQLNEAEELIKKAILIEPDNGAYIDSLGWVYFKRNELDKAIEHLEKASLLLFDPLIYEHLGDAYFKKGVQDKAQASWQKSLELNPAQDKLKEKIGKSRKE